MKKIVKKARNSYNSLSCPFVANEMMIYVSITASGADENESLDCIEYSLWKKKKKNPRLIAPHPPCLSIKQTNIGTGKQTRSCLLLLE